MSTEQILAELDRLLSERKVRDAEQFLDEQVRLAKNTNNTPLLLTLYNEQEGIYRNTGRAALAVVCGEKALELTSVLGLNGSRFHAVTLINTATALRMNHEYGRAVSCYSSALSILSKETTPDALLTATCYNNLSQVWLENHDEAKALDCLEKAYAIIGSLPDKQAEAAITAVNIALSYLSLGRKGDAEEYLHQAGAYYETKEGSIDRHRCAYLCAIAEYSVLSGDRIKASTLYHDALQETLNIYGENDACKRIRQAMKKYDLT